MLGNVLLKVSANGKFNILTVLASPYFLTGFFEVMVQNFRSITLLMKASLTSFKCLITFDVSTYCLYIYI